jgi:hypothetical protein
MKELSYAAGIIFPFYVITLTQTSCIISVAKYQLRIANEA